MTAHFAGKPREIPSVPFERCYAKTGQNDTPATLVIREVDAFEDGTDTLMDTPVDFAKRQFIPRRVCVEPVGGD